MDRQLCWRDHKSSPDSYVCGPYVRRHWRWSDPSAYPPVTGHGRGKLSVCSMLIAFPFLFLFVLFIYLNIKYSNPYKLTFVFGKKGAGKSCYMVRQMHRYLRKGWNVYTDMADIKIPGVRLISVGSLSEFKPEPHSLVCLDEVGISMDNRSYKSFPPGLRDFFKYVRKMQVVVIMNSQAFDVDKKVRDTTDRMILLQSAGSLFCLARPIRRTITLTEPSADSESRIADVLRFTLVFDWKLYYMPAYFRYFDSKSMPPRDDVPYTVVESEERYARGPLYNFFRDVIDLVKFKADSLRRRE